MRNKRVLRRILRCSQFRLRTMLLLIGCVSVFCGLLGSVITEYRTEQQFLESVRIDVIALRTKTSMTRSWLGRLFLPARYLDRVVFLECSTAGARLPALSGIRALSRLEKLYLLGVRLSQSEADAIAALPNLRELAVVDPRTIFDEDVPVTGPDISGICTDDEQQGADFEHLLRYFDIDVYETSKLYNAFIGLPGDRRVALSFDCISALSRSTRLKRIWLPVRVLDEPTARSFLTFQHVEELYLPCCFARDEGCAALGLMSRLRALYVSRSQLSDTGLAYLRRLRDLTDLSLCGTCVSDNAIEALRPLTHVATLELHSRRLTNKGLAALATLPLAQCLIELDLSYSSTNDEGMRSILRFPQLQKLRLAYTQLGDDGLLTLAECRSLERDFVDRRGTNVSFAMNLAYTRGILPAELRRLYQETNSK